MLKGKTALITGGTRGIGLEIALQMAKNGANIAINYVSSDSRANQAKAKVEELGVRCEVYRCDVSDFAATKAMIDKVAADFGRLDILVNNAGITRDGPLAVMTEQDFDTVISGNLKSAFNTTKNVYPHFMRARTGRIINMASVAGIMGTAGQANYASAKAGLIALTKTTAREYGGRGITVNAIAPGFIQSDMTDVLPDEVKKNYLSSTPLRRAGTTLDVANLAVFLASDMSSFITGETIKVDGGLCI